MSKLVPVYNQPPTRNNRMTEWEPIETAKEGWMIVPSQHYSGVSVVLRFDDRDKGYYAGFLDEDMEPLEGFQPTHWQPLPEPPNGVKE